ncbi:MAG: BON domain-containing protein [Ktedonobacterales bacterium]
MARTRSDADIESDVEDELEWAANVDADDIDVSVKDGVVTLTGEADSYFSRIAAEEAALQVFGVGAVINEIDVVLPSSAERTDEDLQEAALYSLTRDVAIPSGNLFVSVSHGIVTLQGQVDWNYQREDAEDIVERLAGVKGVVNLITVSPQPVPTDVAQRIQRALQRNADVNADTITVAVEGNTATLTGVVHSYAEKDAAEDAAWLAPGIMDVDNDITVSY